MMIPCVLCHNVHADFVLVPALADSVKPPLKRL